MVNMTPEDTDHRSLSATGEPLSPSILASPSSSGASISKYTILSQVGTGAYSTVHRARGPEGQIVALKQLQLQLQPEGERDRSSKVPLSVSREIELLRGLSHRNVIRLIDVFTDDGRKEERDEKKDKSSSELWMVMEYTEQDLARLVDDDSVVFKLEEVKGLFKQLLEGIEYLHLHEIIHRDLKTENLLLTHDGVLKLADFNTARSKSLDVKAMTPEVTTLWYAAPEILLGTSHYTASLDLFSSGLVLAEILLREPLVQASDLIGQLDGFIKLLGSPSTSDLDALASMGCPEINIWIGESFIYDRADSLNSRFRLWGQQTVEMIKGLLRWNPRAPWSAGEALGKGRGNEAEGAKEWWESEPHALNPQVAQTKA